MAHMLGVPASELGDPMTLVVVVVPNDRLFHGVSPDSPERASAALRWWNVHRMTPFQIEAYRTLGSATLFARSVSRRGPLHWSEAQTAALLDRMADALLAPGEQPVSLVGIQSGGAWVAAALNERLAAPLPVGTLDVSFYRDDFDTRGLKRSVKPSDLPFEVDGAHLVLVDDVLMTGRTIRAAMNELFDYGRPASIRLVVLFDIGHRELPIRPDICGETLALPPHQRVELRGPAPLVAEVRTIRPDE